MKNKISSPAALLALGTAIISGVSVFVSKIGVTVVKDPVLYTTLKNSFVAILLIGLILVFKKWSEIKTLSKSQWLKLLIIGFIGGSIPFALFFIGLTQTSAISGALIHKTLFLWVFLLATPILKEKMTRLQWLGVGSIFAANFLIGGFAGFKYNLGELMILGATILWAIENIIAKKVLQDISSLTVASARMVFGPLFLIPIVFFRGGIGSVFALNSTQWSWAFIASILLFGYVLTWYTALKHAPATYVSTLLVPATLVTNVLSAIFITHAFGVKDLVSALLNLLGIGLVVFFAKGISKSASMSHTSTPSSA